MPIRLASAMEHERTVVLCPMVTLLPITVSDTWLPRLEVAERTTVPSCMLVLLPIVILPSSPAAELHAGTQLMPGKHAHLGATVAGRTYP